MIVFLLAYFQQYVYYNIKATLDDTLNILEGEECILYTNNSPDSLDTLYFNIFFNSMKKGSRYAKDAEKAGRRFSPPDEKEGNVEITEFKMEGKNAVEIVDTGDVAMIVLPEPILPGWTVEMRLKFKERIPYLYSRMGYRDKHYEMAYWFPQICVYDEKGWHTDGYRWTGEFYNEFGDFDVELDIPSGYVVMGTGMHVGSEDYLKFLDAQIKGEDYSLPKRTKVRFRAERVHNFVWVADTSYIVEERQFDSTKVYTLILPGDEKDWKKIPDRVVRMLKTYSHWIGPYPYKTLVIVDGYVEAGGMEYPNCVVINRRIGKIPLIKDILLEEVICHEVAHQWFFGILGSNEMDYAWLDEGFTSYTEKRYMNLFYPPDSLRKRLLFRIIPIMEIITGVGDAGVYMYENGTYHEPVLGKKACEMKNYYTLAYNKGAMVLRYIHSILGEERFNMLMHDYYDLCKFTHPSPEDFFDILSWYVDSKTLKGIKNMVYSDSTMDVSIESVEKSDHSWVVRLKRSGTELPIPTCIYAGSDKMDTILSTDYLVLNSRPKKIILDPENGISETDEWNNSYPRNWEIKPFLSIPSPDKLSLGFIPVVFKMNQNWHAGITGYTTQIVRHNSIFGFFYSQENPEYCLSITEPAGAGKTVSFTTTRREFSCYDRVSINHFWNDPYKMWWVKTRESIVSRTLPENYFVFRAKGDAGIKTVNWNLSSGLDISVGSSNQDVFGKFRVYLEGELKFFLNPSFYADYSGITGSAPYHEMLFLEGNPFFTGLPELIMPVSEETTPLSPHVSSGKGLSYWSGTGLNGTKKFFVEVAFGMPFIKLYARGGLMDGNFYREVCIGIGTEWFKVEIPIYPFEKEDFYKRWVVRL